MIPIFFAVNDNFVKYLCTALESLKDYMSKDSVYDIHILYSNLSLANQEIIKQIGSKNLPISFHNVEEYFNTELKQSYRWSKEIYYRLIIPYLFDYEKALYFDADIIFQRDPKEIYDLDIGDDYIGAVYEPSNQPFRYGHIDYPFEFTSFWNLRCEGYYFGSGVLVLNLKEFRKAYTFNEVIDYLQSHDLDYMDQDTLNYLCLNHTYGLEANWNCVYQYFHFESQLRQTGKDLYIFHYAGKIKPDLFALRGKFDLFWKYFQRTIFYHDEDYLKAITDYILDYSDEIDLKQVKKNVDETFNLKLAQMYYDTCLKWYEEGEVFSLASIYLLAYVCQKYNLEIMDDILNKYDYYMDEIKMLEAM